MTTLSVQQALVRAVQHHRAGSLSEAEAIYRQILQVLPQQADVIYLLGLICRQTNRPADAATWWMQAVELSPARVEWAGQAIHALLDSGDPTQAATIARRAIQRHPDHAFLYALLGRALAMLRKQDESLEMIRRAVQMAPQSAEIQNHSGLAFQAMQRPGEARDSFARAVALEPNNAAYHRHLAGALEALEELDHAVEEAHAALRLGGEDPQIWINLAILHRRRRDYAAQLHAARRSVELAPNNPEAHGSLAIALLQSGDYRNGFMEYEWRWRCGTFTTRRREFARPMWDGSDPRGRTIYVHSEQGFGDTIQFVRYVPLLADRGATVVFECHPSLRTLLRSVNGISKVVPAGLSPPDFDLHSPLLSLMKWFGTSSVEAVPNSVPYIHADPARVVEWRQRIDAAKRAVGLVWSGNVQPDPNRTCPLSVLAPLAAIEGVTFYSLQVGAAAKELEHAPAGLRIIDLSPHLKDFSETAAAMQCLDLIVTIDSAAAHLAGALARPVWTLLPWAPDWRWGLDREDSPWYPTMRLFRQMQRGDWSHPVRCVAAALRVGT